MQVDVESAITIGRPRQDVAAFASNPENAPRWYVNIKSVRWASEPRVEVGARIAFIAQFLGRQISYTYEITELIPGERLVMRTSQGPFPMETTYTWSDEASGGTLMTLRNRGEPSGFSTIVAPLMARAVKGANQKDLRALKTLMESTAG